MLGNGSTKRSLCEYLPIYIKALFPGHDLPCTLNPIHFCADFLPLRSQFFGVSPLDLT